MTTIVVLGFHRAGTSLVASMLSALGVDMGQNMLGHHPSQPLGHWEDLDFVRMNNSILADHGGTWDDPPDVDWRKLRPELLMLLKMKEHPELGGGEPRSEGQMWGFKDPRTCLTAACYHQYLDDPRYVVVHRNKADAVASLEFREGKAGKHWDKLYDRYLAERDWFLENTDAPRLHLSYERLTDPETAYESCTLLATFLGLDAEMALLALGNIRPRWVDDWTRLPSTAGLEVSELTHVMVKIRQAAETFDPLNIVHLGAEDERLRYACMEAAPGARFVNVKDEGAWQALHGPVHVVIATEDIDADYWAAKVRPGGFYIGLTATDGGRIWQGTAWDYRSWNMPVFQRKPFLQRGDPFGTLAVGTPYFKSDYNFFRWWTWLVRHGLRDSDLLLNDESVRMPVPLPWGHNGLMRRFLETDRDTLLIIEDDHCGDPDPMDYELVERMREKRENWQFDIVTANYVNRRADPLIVGYGLAPHKNRHGEYICMLGLEDVWKTGTQPVDGSVFGLAFIRRWVLDAMLAGGKPSFWHPCEMIGANTQDIQFYGKARDVGAKVGVDRDANLGHGAYTTVGVQDFWAARGESLEEQ